MNIALSPEQEQFIQSQIDRGRFKSADEAAFQAFKLLEEKYRDYENWIEDTRQKVDVAIAELDSAEPTLRERGEGVELDLAIDITRDVLNNPQHLEAYTQEMADDDDRLLDGVEIESEVTQIEPNK